MEREKFEVDEPLLQQLIGGLRPQPAGREAETGGEAQQAETSAETPAAGPIPRPSGKRPASDAPPQAGKSVEPPPEEGPDPAAGGRVLRSQPRRRSDAGEYERRFLVNYPTRLRVHIHIDLELHEKLKKFLPAIGPEMTITGYVNNVLALHLEQYRDVINDLYLKQTQEKPL